MSKEYLNAETIAIIDGADGPTGVFMVGGKRSIKVRITDYLYRRKQKNIAKKMVTGTHTLEEMLQYAQNTYGAKESDYKVNAIPEITRVFEIKEGRDALYIEVDDIAETFGISFSGSEENFKRFQAINKDLYTYYGVSEKDIAENSVRYLSLLGVLCS